MADNALQNSISLPDIRNFFAKLLETVGHPNNEAEEYATKLTQHIIALAASKLVLSMPEEKQSELNGIVSRLQETNNIDELLSTISQYWTEEKTSDAFAQSTHDTLGRYLDEVVPHLDESQKAALEKEAELFFAQSLKNQVQEA